MLVTPRRPRELAHAISYLAADPRLCAEIGRRNRAQAEQKYSWDRMTTRYISLYNGVAAPRPCPPPVAELPSSSW